MATTSYPPSPQLRQWILVERWFFTGIAITMLATSTAGFMPSLVHTAGRRAPLSPLAPRNRSRSSLSVVAGDPA
jgi:hypothetical protein